MKKFTFLMLMLLFSALGYAQPPNDTCAGAITISSDGVIAGTTTGAATESVPFCGAGSTSPGVYYVFTDMSGVGSSVDLSLCTGTSFDSKISVYTGSCGAFTCVVGNDDSCGLQSAVNFMTDGSSTYYVLVHGFGGANGPFELTVSGLPAPPPGGMPDVLVLGAAGDPAWNVDVQTKLDATGRFNSVDVFNLAVGTPTLGQLNAYDAVLVFTDGGANDPTAAGNALGQYIEAGGGVVDATFIPNVPLGGSYQSNYTLYSGGGQASGTTRTLGTVNTPGSPVMMNVNTFNGGTNSWHNVGGTVAAGSVLEAEYDNGDIFVLTKTNVGPAAVNRVFLNFYPPSEDARSDFWLTSTDGTTLTANALIWVANAAPIGDPPVISCPMDITAPNDPGICGATVNFTDALAIDTEDGVIPTTQTGGPASGDVFPLGDTIVTFSATDSDGNTSTCSFTVTVEDTEAPVIACQDITVELDASGMYSLTPAEVLGSSTDNCGIDTVSFSVIGDPITECGNAPLPIPATGTSGPMDPSVAAVADSGIIGVDYTFDNVTLNIIHTWANDLDMTLESPSGTVLELSTDNGGSSGLDSAANLVFTDASGNLITGWTGGAPLADYQPEGGLLNSVFDGEDINGNWTLNITDDTGGDSGTLNSFCLSFSPQATAQPTLDLTCANVGANNVTVVVTDEAGNSSTCSAVVTVEDNIAPEIMCIGAPGNITVVEEFEGGTVPAGWSTQIVSGSWDWTFGSGDMPVGGDFPTNAAIFDDDAAGPSGDNNVASLLSPVWDLSAATSADVSFDYALQDFAGSGLLRAEAWDGAAWQEIFLADNADIDPTNTGSIDVTAYLNAAFQLKFTFDDEDSGWNWGAGVDNVTVNYELPSSPLVVELDGNGMVTVNAADLLMNVDEACGYTVTTGGGGAPVPGTITTLFATNNGGNSGGAVYFDVTVGPEGLSITDIDVNSNATGAFTMEVYTLEGSYVGNEGNAGAWTLSATGSGTGAGIDQPSNMVLDVPVELMAGTTYGMALVMDSNADHRYTNGDGTNESYSNADLSLQLGAASNTPFDGSPFSPRVWNGTLNYLVGSAPSETIEFDCSNLGVNTVEITVTDDSGNMATCTASVEVIDVTDPVLICQDFTIVLDENGEAVVNPEDLLAQLPTTYEAVVIGSDNGSGTAGTTDFTVPVTDAAAISFDWAYTSNDAPGFDSFGYVLNGVYTQLTDPAQGNQSGTANVNVAPGDVFGYRSQTDDNILGNNETLITNFVPGYTGQFAPENWTLSLNNSDGDAYFIEIPGGPASYDNCGITILATDITDVTCADIGTPITVTVFASDASGNLASCTSIITVVDESGPVIENCPEDQTVDPGPNNLFYELPDYWTTGATATDNCTDPVTLLSQDPAAGTLLPDGTYTITLFAEDEYGNVSECTFELTIESVLGVDDQQLESGVVIYPNPAQGVMNISNSTNIELERAAIYDVNGRLVQNINLSNMATEKAVDVSNLSSGVYMVQIQSNDGQTVKRLVKE